MLSLLAGTSPKVSVCMQGGEDQTHGLTWDLSKLQLGSMHGLPIGTNRSLDAMQMNSTLTASCKALNNGRSWKDTFFQ